MSFLPFCGSNRSGSGAAVAATALDRVGDHLFSLFVARSLNSAIDSLFDIAAMLSGNLLMSQLREGLGRCYDWGWDCVILNELSWSWSSINLNKFVVSLLGTDIRLTFDTAGCRRRVIRVEKILECCKKTGKTSLRVMRNRTVPNPMNVYVDLGISRGLPCLLQSLFCVIYFSDIPHHRFHYWTTGHPKERRARALSYARVRSVTPYYQIRFLHCNK